MSTAPDRRYFRTPLMLLLVAVLAVASYHWILGLQFTGLDAGPLLEANRFDRGDARLAFLGQEIRDGIQPEVAFYRPLTGFSHAVDQAIFGLHAPGHQLTQILLHTACAVVLLMLLLALEAPVAGALLGAAWFAVHPMGVEVVPCVARRAEMWMGLCLMLACLGWLRRAKGRPDGLTLLLLGGLLAPLGKETGAVLPGLLFVLAARGHRRSALIWGFALVVPAIALRTLALRGTGGYDGLDFTLAGMIPALGDLFDPARIGGRWPVRIGVGLVLLVGVLLALKGRAEDRPLYRFGPAWLVLLLGPATLAGGLSPWYLYAPLIGAAMIVAGLFATRELGEDLRRRVAFGVLTTLVVLPGFMVSPMAVPYPEWFEVSRQNQVWWRTLEELPEEFFDGPQLVAGLPFDVEYPDRNGVRVRAATGMSDFSLRAWSRLLLNRDCDPRNAGLVRIVHPARYYSVQVSWIPGESAARLRAQGPATLFLYEEEHLFERLESERDEVKFRAPEAPLWRWNGKRLAPVNLPLD